MSVPRNPSISLLCAIYHFLKSVFSSLVPELFFSGIRELIIHFADSFAAYQNVQASAIENANKLTDSMRVKRQTTVAEDIVIVMDGSGSSNACEFEKGKRALKNLMGKMRVPGYDTKYAAVTFSNSASVNFKFLPSSSAANEIMKIPHPGGSTNTQAGLAEAKNLFDDPSSGIVTLSVGD